MLSIFYDLETSCLNPVGQILNFAFVAVDENWNVVSEYCDIIKISRLQLPRIGAILVNRVDAIEHQKNATLTEPMAMQKIRNFIESVILKNKGSGEPVTLIGYNSSKFDLPYLRTSMIRNGICPYFGKNLIYRDLSHVVQKLATCNKDFQKQIYDEKGEASFKLESFAQVFGVLEGKQLHESRDDALITMKLAKELCLRYEIDVRSFEAYEVDNYLMQEEIVQKEFPANFTNYYRDDGDPGKARMTLLDYKGPYSLWIDLDGYAQGKGRDCISWYNANISSFFVNENCIINDKELEKIRIRALGDFSHMTVNNFFPEANCDIESFIYMMSFAENNALSDAIWCNDFLGIQELQSKHASTLYLRHKIANNELNESLCNLLKNYALYRYGGKMKTNKLDSESVYQPGIYNESFHTTWNEQMQEIEDVLYKALPEHADTKLAKSLKEYYLNSDIYKIVGTDLEQIHLEKTDGDR